MKKLLMTTTALIALGGVTTALADISISGNTRWTYTSWSDDTVDPAGSGNNNTSMGEVLQLWFKVNETADTGMTYGAAVRFRRTNKGVDRNYVHISDDWGKITLGRQFSPFTTGSLGANWRGTMSGVQNGVGDVTGGDNGGIITDSWVNPSGTAPKLIYQSPDIAGLKVSFSMADGGSGNKADATAYRINYGTDIMSGTDMTVGYAVEKVKAIDGTSMEDEVTHSEMGVAVASGDLTASLVRIGEKSDRNDGIKLSDQKADELEVAYAVSDVITVNLIHLRSEEDQGPSKDSKFTSNELGLKYTIAPGLTANVTHTTADFKASTTSGLKSNDGSSTHVQIRLNF